MLHWTGRYQTANTMCIACHTTGFEKRYDADADRFSSRWLQTNVSCQSCHGPGERHAAWARERAAGKTPAAPAQRYGLVADPRAANGRQQVEICAACHSRRGELVATPVPGRPRLDEYLPALLTPGLYHADGQQLDEVYVDGSFRQSRMYQKGVVCSNCHNPHTGKLRQAGNAVCLQCHAAQANPAFPTAAGNYDTPAHHFHKSGSAGAQCAGCHMPSKIYMQIQARPDHSLRVPRPDLSVKLGVPNACNNCHADKTAKWAADRVVQWYGPRRKQGTHYGEALAAARAGQSSAVDALSALIADAQTPGIVRASALAALRGQPVAASVKAAATRDADPEVRAAAASSMDAAAPEDRLRALIPLLTDPVRAVRMAAALSLSSLPPDQIDASVRPRFDAALAEFIAAQAVSLDMPGAHLNQAVAYQNTGRSELAEKHYLAALKIDPDFTPARANLSGLYNATSRNADAERILRDGLKRLPNIGELQYSLGLLLAEEKRLPESAAALEKAAKLMPERARVQYNLGLALQELKRRGPAEAALLKAQRLDPRDPEIAYALATFYYQGGQRAQALSWAEKLDALVPGQPEVREFIARLRAGR